MTAKIPTIAIVGRTNVGKSTLFNALAGRELAIVEDSPGVTRDRNYTLVRRFGSPFTLIDTGGLFGEEKTELIASVKAQTEAAIEEADLILVVFDGVAGPQPADEEVVQMLRRGQKPCLWVVNKCEREVTEGASAEFYSLGVDDLFLVSAAHRKGIKELGKVLLQRLGLSDEPTAPKDPNEPLRVAIIGKPNVGKSSLINKILGEDRLVASPIAGTTRDAVNIELTREGHRYVIVDTAGLRKKARVTDESLEHQANLHTLKALADCDVAIVVLDASTGITEQDAKIAGLVHERGRPMVLAVNKWDAVEKDHRTVKEYADAVYGVLKFARYAPIVFTSAATGRRLPNVLRKAKEISLIAQERIKTAELNKILENATHRKPPPVYRAQPIKVFFATQTDSVPPTIVLFVNYPDGINFSYQRYLKNEIRKHHAYEGSDVKLILRKRTEKESVRKGAGV